ncbi:hypothetical protein D9M72_438680 [compost metagenome]
MQVERARSPVAFQVRKSARSKNCQAVAKTCGRFSFSQSSFGVCISGETRPPTYRSTSWPTALIRSAWPTARWSIHMMMSRSGRSDGPTASGAPPSPSTTSEQVASKPRPITAAGSTPAEVTASRTLEQTASQISALDCSTIAPASRNSEMSRLAEASIAPERSNRPARALAVPTSTPTT